MNKLATLSTISALTLATGLNANAAEVEISGLIEAEANFASDFNDVDSSDIALATVELGFDAQINDRVSSSVLLLHEDDDTEPMEVDEGTITVDLTNGWSVTAGRMYVPFGVFESNMVSDPLTLELGETREAALLLGYEANGLYASAYAFNGDTSETSTPAGEDTIEHTGVSIGYAMESGAHSLDVGLGYISSIGDSDGLSPALDGNADGTPDPLTSFVSGTALHAIYTRDALSLIFEHVAADDFAVGELAFKGQGASISATNLELGYEFAWGSAAIGYQMTEEAVALGLPESRILLAASKEIFENTSLSVEYATDEDYSITDGGTGNDASSLTLQLAVEF